MKKSSLIFIITCCILIGALSCDKTPVGYGEMERDISEATFIELRTNDRFCYGKYVSFGTARNLVLGKNTNYESRILMQFALSDSLLDSVQKVKLVLYPSRHKAVHFKIYPVSSEWKQAHATWVTMDENAWWDNTGGDYYPTVLAETTLTQDSCIIELKRNKLDTLVNHCEGIILIPDTSLMDFAMINSYDVNSSKPRIIYQYRNYNEAFYPSEDCHIIDTTNLSLGMFDYWIGAGFPYRTSLRFPVTESLPPNVTIAYAELFLPIAQKFSMTDTFFICGRKILDSMPFNISTQFADYTSKSDTIIPTDTLIRLDVRSIVQFWNDNRDKDSIIKNRLILTSSQESYGINRVQLKTTAPGIRLKIGYITPPKGRF